MHVTKGSEVWDRQTASPVPFAASWIILVSIVIKLCQPYSIFYHMRAYHVASVSPAPAQSTKTLLHSSSYEPYLYTYIYIYNCYRRLCTPKKSDSAMENPCVVTAYTEDAMGRSWWSIDLTLSTVLDRMILLPHHPSQLSWNCVLKRRCVISWVMDLRTPNLRHSSLDCSAFCFQKWRPRQSGCRRLKSAGVK